MKFTGTVAHEPLRKEAADRQIRGLLPLVCTRSEIDRMALNEVVLM
ncbi:MAG: hypothetical protein R6V60_14065 [Desulfobacterales bacterium]